MKNWILNRWDVLRTNFRFVPTVMVALSFAAISLDGAQREDNGFAALGWTVSRGPEGSRVLGAVASTEITIARLASPITIVAPLLASSQFGPGLRHQFRRSSRGHAAVTLRLLEVIADAGRQVLAPSFRAVPWRHARMMACGAEKALLKPTEVAERFERMRPAVRPDQFEDPGTAPNGTTDGLAAMAAGRT